MENKIFMETEKSKSKYNFPPIAGNSGYPEGTEILINKNLTGKNSEFCGMFAYLTYFENYEIGSDVAAIVKTKNGMKTINLIKSQYTVIYNDWLKEYEKKKAISDYMRSLGSTKSAKKAENCRKNGEKHLSNEEKEKRNSFYKMKISDLLSKKGNI